MIRHFLLNILCLIFLINCTNGVHLEHSDKDGFQSYMNIDRYRQKQSSCNAFRFLDSENCPCGEDMVNKMALVYFDRFDKNDDDEEVPERYLVSQTKLGNGGFSKTYHVTPITDTNQPQQCVALKIAAPALETHTQGHGVEELKKEAVILADLSKFNNKHIIKLKEIVLYEDGHGMDKIAILMEIGGNSLRTYASEMMGNADIDENKFLWIVKQMLMGLNEVHHAGYIYFDLKPSNMLIMPYPIIYEQRERQMHEVYLKFIDFAGARKVPEHGKLNGHFDRITTPLYEAPELVQGKNIGKAFDIWSLGISILYLLSHTETYTRYLNDEVYIIEAYKEGARWDDLEWIRKRKPFEKKDKLLSTLSLKMIARNKPNDFEKLAPLLRELDGQFPRSMKIIRDCLKEDPDKRPTMGELLTRYEEIFKGIDLESLYVHSRESIAETSGASSSLEITHEKILERLKDRIDENRAQRGSTSDGASPSGNVVHQLSPPYQTPIGRPSIQTPAGTPTGHGRSTSRVKKLRSLIAKRGKSVELADK